MKKIHDIIVIGAGAAGLFSAIQIPNKYSKLILEKNQKAGVKVLLSGGERANVSNIDIDGERDYFGQNTKVLKSVFSRFSQWDIMSWFSENGTNIVEEDRGRLILESGDSKELLEVLVRKARENNSEIITKQDVDKVEKINYPHPSSGTSPLQEEGIFVVTTTEGIEYSGRNVIVSSGGKSFFQVGTTGEGYNFAKEFGLNIVPPTRALGGLSTKKDLSEISGSSCVLNISIYDKSDTKKHNIYSETGPLLFTHFGISGPIVFNAGNAIGEYTSGLGLNISNKDFGEIDIIYENYLKENIYIELTFNTQNTPKKIVKYFDMDTPINKFGKQIENNKHSLELQNWRSWKEAKATGGGVDMNELDKYFESKKHPGLFFIGEVCDITGKTGGFNLQWAWSSAYCCGEFFMRNNGL